MSTIRTRTLGRNIAFTIIALFFLALTSIDKAKANCDGTLDGKTESLRIELLLWNWWHPVSFFKGDFLDGRKGYAKVYMYGQLNEKGGLLGTLYDYELHDQGYGTLWFGHKEDANATYGTVAWLDEHQKLSGMFEGFLVDMKCTAALNL